MKNLAILSAVGVAALALSASQPALADPTNPLAPYVGQTVTMTVQPYASGENNGQYYTGLTTVNAVAGGNNLSFQAFCDDFAHEISLPDTYKATVEAISGAIMEQEAYYGLMFGTTPSGNAARDSEIQELIWNYTAPTDKQYALNSDMQAMQQQMLANYANTDFSNSFYLSAGDAGQSFMVTSAADTSVAPTPEPSSLVLLSTGLMSMGAFLRRRIAKQA